MLTREEWLTAPPWANAYSNGLFVNIKPYDKAFADAEIRPYDTYSCPFCGGTDLAIETTNWFGELFYVDCKRETDHGELCATGPRCRTVALAWEAWAKRAAG